VVYFGLIPGPTLNPCPCVALRKFRIKLRNFRCFGHFLSHPRPTFAHHPSTSHHLFFQLFPAVTATPPTYIYHHSWRTFGISSWNIERQTNNVYTRKTCRANLDFKIKIKVVRIKFLNYWSLLDISRREHFITSTSMFSLGVTRRREGVNPVYPEDSG